MTKEMIFISILSVSLALTVISLQAHRMEHTCLNSLGLLEYATRLEIFHDRNSIISRYDFLDHKLGKTFGKFYNRHFDLIKQFNTSLINLIKVGISHSHFY